MPDEQPILIQCHFFAEFLIAPAGPQPIDGHSLVPVLRDPSVRVRDHAFHAYLKDKLSRAIRTERYRMVEWKPTGDYEKQAEYELYDYQSDPLETRNLAGELPAILERLKAILATYPPLVPQVPKIGLRIPTRSSAMIASPLPHAFSGHSIFSPMDWPRAPLCPVCSGGSQ